jgi:lysyl endopeptidase
VRRVELPVAAAALLDKASAPARMGVPQQVGFARDVAELSDGVASVARLNWTALASGARVAAFSVTSSDAASIRVGLRAKAIPSKTLLRFYAPDTGPVIEVSAEELQETIGRNLAAGAVSESALVFWSPVIEGPTAVVEIELPVGSTPAQLDLGAPQVSHLVTSPGRGFAMPKVGGVTAGSCNNDVVCYLATWNIESNAVARMLFTDAGTSYFCTGTLLSDLDSATSIPYFLSANHCIDNQPAASTLETYWFFRSAACNSSVTYSGVTDLTGGATLLYNSTKTDTSLMKLAAPPPGGAMYAGWSVGSTPAVGASVVGVHNPRGGPQKISFGSISDYTTCTSSGSESFNCSPGTAASGATFMEVSWNSGVTEPGSSGSALFLNTGHYVIGQLYGGTTSCSTPGVGFDFFGRFDLAFTAGLSKYLAPSGGTTSPPSGATGIVPTFDYTALWWNPSESGWGMGITQHASSLFAAWYVYGPNGSPTWLVMPGGAWTSPTSITGDLYSTTGPPSGGPFDASQVTKQRVGSATIAFSAVDQAVLSYTVNGVSGTKAIQRENFGVADGSAVSNYADLWWTSTESGWGLSVNQQYRTLFSVIYTYGPSGEPRWYVMPGGSWTGSTTYSGALYGTSMPAFNYFGAAFNPANISTQAVGTMSIQFSGTDSATLTYTVDGQTFTKAITREPF